MNHTRDHVTPRRNSRETPHPALNRCVEGEGATSLAVQASCLDWPHRIMTTDPVSPSSSRGDDTTELVGTPCGMGNPRELVRRKAWGRLLHMLEVNPSMATWGRSRLTEASNQALKVWTWGRTTDARFLTRNPAGDVPNQTAWLGVA